MSLLSGRARADGRLTHLPYKSVSFGDTTRSLQHDFNAVITNDTAIVESINQPASYAARYPLSDVTNVLRPSAHGTMQSSTNNNFTGNKRDLNTSPVISKRTRGDENQTNMFNVNVSISTTNGTLQHNIDKSINNGTAAGATGPENSSVANLSTSISARAPRRADVITSIIFEDGKIFKGNPWITKYEAFKSARTEQPVYTEYYDLGDPTYKCSECKAIFWWEKRIGKNLPGAAKTNNPVYSKCCMHGKIKLAAVLEPSDEYKLLLYSNNDLPKAYFKTIRRCNNVFAFTSMGGKVDNTTRKGSGPPCFKIHGDNYHCIGGLLPVDEFAKFAQLYIYDTENEIQNRLRAAGKGNSDEDKLNEAVILYLKNDLDRKNELVKLFRQVGETVSQNKESQYSLKLIARRSADGRTTSKTCASEIAALVPGTLAQLENDRDIIVHSHAKGLQRISQLHVLYLPLQYPLIYLEGQDGFRKGILHNKTAKTKETKDRFVTMHEYIIYYMHERAHESPHLMFSRRLFQQWLVDVFTMVESYRLAFYRLKQEQWRFGTYHALDDAFNKGDTSGATVGKRIRLPPSFVNGPRFLMQNYHDAMTICRYYGYPTLFITFTCNSKWPEIGRYIKDRGLTNPDRTDIQCRLFHTKLKLLMDDIMVHHIFGVDTAS